MARYPVILENDDNDTVLVRFPDFPEAATFGETKEDALVRALDALETVIAAYISDRRPIPAPSAVTGDAVNLPALVATKVQLYQTMVANRVNKTELARRLNVHAPQVDRLLNIRHGSKLEQLEAAASALGLRLTVTLAAVEGKWVNRNVKVRTPGPLTPTRLSRLRPGPKVHSGVLAASASHWKQAVKKR